MAALSAFIIFSNRMGFLAMKLMLSQGAPMNDLFFSNFELIAISGLTIGVGFLISGISIARYRNWGRWLGILVSIFSIIAIWALMTFMRTGTEELGPFANFLLLVAFFWSILPTLLIYYLNRRTVKQRFA